MTARRWTRTFLPLAVLLAGCSGGDPNDPCSGIDCSGNGVCLSEGASVYCWCVPTYHPVLLECVPNDPVNPCTGIDCAGHGTCRVEGTVPACDCDPGYRPDSGSRLVCLPDTPSDAGTETADVPAARCGNRVVESGEQCDDGNDVQDDGCRNDCRWTCETHPACDDLDTCTEDLCGVEHTCSHLTVTDGRPCAGGMCCGTGCADIWSDPAHCGGCGRECPGGLNAGPACAGGACTLACFPGYHDVDGRPGCEYRCERTSGLDSCNAVDDDCDGDTDEDGCGSSVQYCLDGACHPRPTFEQGPACADFGTAHPPPDALAYYTVRGRPGAEVHKWNRHVSCPGAVAEEGPETMVVPPIRLDAAGLYVLRIETLAPITDCVHPNLGSYESWAVVDGIETNRVTTAGFNSLCPTVATCALGAAACP
jgi:cysteine-rich repeat protein